MRLRVFLTLLAVWCAGASRKARQLRAAGDEAFQKGNMKKANMFYDNCLKLEPTNAGHLYQRFQVYLREKKYDEALGDILAATSLEPTFAQGWLQRARLHRALGKCDKAQDDLVHLDTLDPKLGATEKEGTAACERHLESAVKAFKQDDFKTAVDDYTKALESAQLSAFILQKRAEAQMKLQNYDEVLADTGRALMYGQSSVTVLTLRGTAYYLAGDNKMALRHFKQGLHYEPKHRQCLIYSRRLQRYAKQRKGAEAQGKGGNHSAAAEIYRGLPLVDPDNLQFNKQALVWESEAWLRGEALDEALAAATSAVELDGGYAQAYVAQANAHLGHVSGNSTDLEDMGGAAEHVDLAIGCLRKAHSLRPSDDEITAALNRASKQQAKKDYYKTLGVERDAPDRAIKKAFRTLSLKYHPDKQMGGEEDKQAAAKIFTQLGEAYEVLSSAELRKKHDKGEEIPGMSGSGGGGPAATTQGKPAAGGNNNRNGFQF